MHQKIFDWLCTLSEREFLLYAKSFQLTVVLGVYTALTIYFDELDAYSLHIFIIGFAVYQADYTCREIWKFHLTRRPNNTGAANHEKD